MNHNKPKKARSNIVVINPSPKEPMHLRYLMIRLRKWILQKKELDKLQQQVETAKDPKLIVSNMWTNFEMRGNKHHPKPLTHH